MKKITYSETRVDFKKDEFLENELPFTKSVVESGIVTVSTRPDRMPLAEQIDALFGGYEREVVKFYHIPEEFAESITDTMTRYADALKRAAYSILLEPLEVQKHFLYDPGTGMTEPQFAVLMEMALDGISHHPSVVGRFDTVVNPETGVIEGVYEYNGDTPVLLAETVSLQNKLTIAVTGDNYRQSNHWYESIIEGMSGRVVGKNIAIICDLNFMEEVSSYEVLSQALEEAGANVYIDDHNQLRDDSFKLTNPFVLLGAEDVEFDYIFSLVPWEDMIQNGWHLFQNYKFWKHNVKLIEPAWKWVMGNKGLMAYVTKCIEDKRGGFDTVFRDLPHIPTYLSKEEAIIKLDGNFFTKPFNGRMSQGVSEWRFGEITASKDAYHEENRLVYQKPVPAHCIDGQNNFMVATWTGGLGLECQALAFRVFNKERPFLDWDTEYYAPHIVELK